MSLLGVVNDPSAVKEFRNIWTNLLKQGVGLICYMENSKQEEKPIIAGMNVTELVKKEEKGLIKVRMDVSNTNNLLVMIIYNNSN